MKATHLILLALMSSGLVACSKKKGQHTHTETVRTEIKTEINTEIKTETDTVTVVKENTNTIFETIVEQKILTNGEVELDTLKLTPMGTAKLASTATFACAINIDEAIVISNGLILLNNSAALIKRDLTSDQKIKGYATFDCKNDVAEQMENVDPDLVEIKIIRSGDALVEYVVLAGDRPNIDQSELSYISCSESKEAALTILTHGVNLIKGSRLIVRRDNRKAGSAEFSLIQCE